MPRERKAFWPLVKPHVIVASFTSRVSEHTNINADCASQTRATCRLIRPCSTPMALLFMLPVEARKAKSNTRFCMYPPTVHTCICLNMAAKYVLLISRVTSRRQAPSTGRNASVAALSRTYSDLPTNSDARSICSEGGRREKAGSTFFAKK